ncbi:hypothetical protein L1787_12895 [Acuticoccus sp. M5D2P5]|uniref:hypothetical protein n=1 Tax=Acuticoccus kalidii TaxID=2910977 RepID=UPI001F2DAF8B|nr:hypothetical protein [Acuticoccus kalidii]MCF3934306.1 hypothetical protein [Acuticoccus kalidii]
MTPTREFVLVAFDEIFPDKWRIMELLTPAPDADGRMTVSCMENHSRQYVILASEVIARGTLETCHEGRRMRRQSMATEIAWFELVDAKASKAIAARIEALEAVAKKSFELRAIPNAWGNTTQEVA